MRRAKLRQRNDTTHIEDKEEEEKQDLVKEKSDFKEGMVGVSKIDDEYERMFQKDYLPSEIRPKKNMKFENGDEHKGKVIEVNKPNSKYKFKCLIKLKEGKIIEVDFENEIKNWKYLLDKEEKRSKRKRNEEKYGIKQYRNLLDENIK